MKTDILIIGTGIAGCTAALKLAEHFDNITIITKSAEPEQCTTYFAQGGIVYKGEEDSPEKLTKDITYAGAGLCYEDAVRTMAEEGPRIVEDILMKKCDVKFSHKYDGYLDMTEEGSHSVKRIIHSEDSTGKYIIKAMLNKIKQNKNITLLTDTTAIDLLTLEHHTKDKFAVYKDPVCLGCYAYDNKNDKVIKILANVTILATGGMGRIYLHTSNPKSSTGDGFAMASRAGVKLINMEYTQFHPTTLFHKESDRFLITEAIRGEGGVLLTQDGNEFMHKYHQLKDLAPRDIVTRSILQELHERREEYVYLDLSNIKSDVKERFPTIYKKCKEYNIDITKDRIPVVPAYHFSCGGVKTSLNGKTSIDRLYAVGEVACTGVHGANRLASTSLLEGVVFGYRASEHIQSKWKEYYSKEICEDVYDWYEPAEIDNVDSALVVQDWSTIKNITWNYVGPLRSKNRLNRAINDLRNLRDTIEDFYRIIKVNKDIIELRNAVQVSLIIAHSSWINKQSKGCHYRKN
jgi:L-aspartate oxidase